MRYIAVLLTAILSLSCAANAGGIWGEPAEIAPIQSTGSTNDPLVGQANVTRQPAASSRKTNGLRSGGTVSGSSTAPASGPRTADAPKARTTGFRADGAYEIGPLDVLDISVFQVPELTKSVQVTDTGTVNLPLVGEIPVAGKTAQEVERDLTARLGAEYVQNPQVTVYVKEYNSQSVTITGAVQSPGVYSIKGKASLLRVVAMAGGLSDNSDSTVLVLRQSDGKRSATKVDISAIQDGKAEDPALQSGDKLLAGTSAIKQAFNTILKGLPIAGTAKGVAGGAQ
jgi:polysaccharide export outer membrane protein